MAVFSDKCKGQMVPVFYHADYAICENVLKACYAGGVRMFEFTNRGEAAYDNFVKMQALAKAQMPDMQIGVGSVVRGEDAKRFIEAGAAFIVGPCFSQPVLEVCQQMAIPYIPGCGTVTEIFNAQQAGCEVTKLFPGDVYGPNMVKDLMAPMPWSKVMVTGGVAPEKENLEKWFKAGALCVGMGSKLFPKEVLAAQDWTYVTNKCKECFEIISKL
ncbi:MAG: bifunctional 4-hydroxy-2-oxoglutarate aldolase/2-dehydro-3-deoxy-phosphogluconate aldolase [Paludibacteraceae bacterium]|nr:bifunctional 4-hydroxy-2-oxoglutarate aldolase/2-dehydro-3-deoxy-phosphogluconate aldolase [Paludibacteraceae bacterium]